MYCVYVVAVVFYNRLSSCVAIGFFFQAEDGIRDLVRSRGLGDVYKRQVYYGALQLGWTVLDRMDNERQVFPFQSQLYFPRPCLLYTSDAADERSSVDLGGRRIIKKKTREVTCS